MHITISNLENDYHFSSLAVTSFYFSFLCKEFKTVRLSFINPCSKHYHDLVSDNDLISVFIDIIKIIYLCNSKFLKLSGFPLNKGNQYLNA